MTPIVQQIVAQIPAWQNARSITAELHLVTRFIEGYEWTREEFRAPDVIRRVAETMQRLHALPPTNGVLKRVPERVLTHFG